MKPSASMESPVARFQASGLESGVKGVVDAGGEGGADAVVGSGRGDGGGVVEDETSVGELVYVWCLDSG